MRIEQIRDSFSAVVPHFSEVMNHYVETLRRNFPNTAQLINELDNLEHRKNLTLFLSHVIETWEHHDELEKCLNCAGVHLASLGVKPEHYEAFGKSLITTLSYVFSESWNLDLEKDWLTFYGFLARNLLEGVKHDLHTKVQQLHLSQHSEEPADSQIKLKAIPQDHASKSLDDLARIMARNLLHAAMTEEVNDLLIQTAREKVRNILRKAMEDEVRELTLIFKKKAA